MAHRVQIDPEERDAPWGETLASQASEALVFTEARLGVALDAPPRVRSIAPETAFYAALGRRPHRIVAVALASENRVLINRAKYLEMGRYERHQVLVHEFTHLVLGRMVPSGVPRWLDEGLAMLVAGEQSLDGSLRVAVAASFGGLVSLDELWGGAEAGVINQDLAYAESLSASRFFLESGAWGPYGAQDGLQDMVRKLAHPEQGRALRDLLADAGFIRAFERRWVESIRGVWSWVAALTSAGFFWIGVSGLFLLAYWRKRRMTQRVEAEWAEAEASRPGEGKLTPWMEEDEKEQARWESW